MKVLHTGFMSVPMSGVLRQMEMEQESANRLGLNWTSSYYLWQGPESPVVTQSKVSSDNRTRFKISYYRWLLQESSKYDVILLRYAIHDPIQLLFILMCRKPIYSVHHTLEVPELIALRANQKSRNPLLTIKIVAEKVLGSLSLSAVDGVIGVLEDIRQYNVNRRLKKTPIDSIVYSNGVEYYTPPLLVDKRSADQNTLEKQAKPVMLFVSSVYGPWQGLEELIEAAKSYAPEFVCHVVGELDETQRSLVATDSRFIAHGTLSADHIAELSCRSDIGLSILAAYKKKMKGIPALKVREYLKEGLAVYAGHEDVLPADFAFYKCGPIDIDLICEFAIASRSNNRKTISDSARPFIEKEIVVGQVYAFLEESVGN